MAESYFLETCLCINDVRILFLRADSAVSKKIVSCAKDALISFWKANFTKDLVFTKNASCVKRIFLEKCNLGDKLSKPSFKSIDQIVLYAASISDGSLVFGQNYPLKRYLGTSSTQNTFLSLQST